MDEAKFNTIETARQLVDGGRRFVRDTQGRIRVENLLPSLSAVTNQFSHREKWLRLRLTRLRAG